MINKINLFIIKKYLNILLIIIKKKIVMENKNTCLSYSLNISSNNHI